MFLYRSQVIPIGNNIRLLKGFIRPALLLVQSCDKNKKALCSNKISLSVRLRIFNALVATIFLYNSELWALTKKETKKIDTFQRNFLRQIIRIKKKINNTSLYKKCKTVHWSIQIQERRLKWFGHLHRLPKETPARKAYDEAT